MMRSRASVHWSVCWTLTFGSGIGYGDSIDFVVLFSQVVSIILPDFPLLVSRWQYCCGARQVPIIENPSIIHKKAIGLLSANCGEFKNIMMGKCSVMVKYVSRRTS